MVQRRGREQVGKRIETTVAAATALDAAALPVTIEKGDTLMVVPCAAVGTYAIRLHLRLEMRWGRAGCGLSYRWQ
ncbi:MAG: hypothetical protein R8J85_01990 [Mariprofundales bacterium]